MEHCCDNCGHGTRYGDGVYCDLKYPETCPECGGWEQHGTCDCAKKAKHDEGKPRLSLVPPAIVEAVARAREHGVKKYHDPDNWRHVDPERYVDAMMRHIWAYLRDPRGVDEESGLPHLEHVATNVAFLLELGRDDDDS